MRIAIDAMGGDHAPAVNVKGAILAAKEWSDVEIILVGDTAKIQPYITESLPNLRIHHTEEMILNEDEPVKAVRSKKNSSMVVAGRLVKDHEADAMISAGNTGALMATGLLVIGRIQGVDRPALAPMMPTQDGLGVLALDMGANMDATAEHLVQYAIMGSVYRRIMHGIDKPRVGLLNVGIEDTKGNEISKSAFSLLKEAPVHFVGNVESSDVLLGKCDVLVCDGFVGNIMLKSFEGAAHLIFSALRQEFTHSFITKLAASLLKSRLRIIKKQMDYQEYGGAPLLGIQGVCIKCHGSSSDENVVRLAVRQARSALANKLVQSIADEINRK